MKSKWLSAPVLVCALVALVLTACTFGPFMHETDQAWLLDGAVNIVNGQLDWTRAEFNFDKQFVSYFLPVPLFALLPRPFDADTLVLTGNLLGLVFFWGAMLWLLARSFRKLSLALVLPVILAPTFLVHSPFYASAFVSAGLVFLLAGFLDRREWQWWHRATVFALAFLAVGARADAILILPLLAMLHGPHRTFAAVWRSPNTWLMASAGVIAILLGRWLYLAPLVDFAAHPFKLKQVAAYLIFGLGGAGLVLLAGFAALGRQWGAARSRWWLVFAALGMAIPLTYYCLQLLSPRHCTVSATVALVFLCAPAGRALFHPLLRPRRLRGMLKAVFVAAALGPVLVGLDLDDLKHPRLTLTQPTLLPSVAGVCPTGAYLGHAWNVRRQQGYIDHNHAIWMAAKTTRFEPAAAQRVDIIGTPVESYLIFAIRLQGLEPVHYALRPGELPPQFYMDSRSLMRFQYLWPASLMSLESIFANTSLEPATATNWRGITLLRGNTNQPPAPGSLPARLWVLNECFDGDEFRLEPAAAEMPVPAAWNGHKLVLAGEKKFTVTIGSASHAVRPVHTRLGNWEVCEIGSLRAGDRILVQGISPAEITAAVSAFPAWMSLGRL